MGIMAVSLNFIGPNKEKLQEEIDNSMVEISALESAVKPIESVAVRLDTAKDISDLSVQFSQLIPEIGAVLPNGTVLNALSLNGGITDPLQLNVDLTSSNLVPVLIRNLVESDLFEAADISGINPKGGGGENDNVYNFSASITASFTGSAEAKKRVEDAAKAQAAAAARAAEEAAAQ